MCDASKRPFRCETESNCWGGLVYACAHLVSSVRQNDEPALESDYVKAVGR